GGDVGQAVPLLERSLELGQASSLLLIFPRVASSLGAAWALSGRTADAIELLARAVDEAASIKLMNMSSIFLAWLGEAYLMAGRTDDALEVAGRALHLSRQQKQRGHEADAQHTPGEVAFRGAPPGHGRPGGSHPAALAPAQRLG